MARKTGSTRARAAILGLSLSVVSTLASASVVMNATRYIYAADDKEITVKVSNVGKSPVLSQAWIDSGDAKATPETVNVPFNLTPPIARIEAGKAQTLRISFTEADLPIDRESQFWINVLEVPPKPAETENDSNHIQLAVRYRLKLFYRPKGLKGTPDDAASHLVWSRVGTNAVSVHNDSAFHVTVNDASLKADGGSHSIEPFALAPRSSKRIEVESLSSGTEKADVTYQTINDYGGFVEHSTTL
ncbi:fimbria/pilus periplasmic chaperone [Luteibacter aegosomatis]|uniref:fimbrial biogenesis chaperone n=1 Tax=Luteibacter aegosomatis TaxID=2911537 RepID=UPI001FF7CC28|nr:fimbria/pilus periplasmic chaperone [Luteibacter aegosomatis]UPG85907.1 fimbria/pilus periplasmic chaperone [Luteibacter aegosomatis]